MGVHLSNLFWKLNRLHAMGGREIVYRLRQAIQSRLEEYGLGLARPGDPDGAPGRAWLKTLPSDCELVVYWAAANRVLAGRFDVFAMKDIELGFPPHWNRDPKTGKVAPLEFGKALNYRDERIVGDIKYLWEPNRHAELVTLAQAWHLTGEMKYADGCRTLLDSWFEQCPYPFGVNWTSSLEHSLRLVNWSFAWFLLGGEASPLFVGDQGKAFSCRWQGSIYRHLHFIAGHFSRHSSANNHLLGELMGLFIGSTAWPLWPEARQWQKMARDELEREALKQTATDGVNREQAIWYHHEVADMMLLCGLVGRSNGIEFSNGYWQRLEAMLDFIAALMDVGGNLPMIGDADDAEIVRFSREADFNVYRSLLATGAVLFQRGDFKAKAGNFDDKSRWLLGDTAAAAFDALPVDGGCDPARLDFPDGGYHVLGADFELPSEVRIIADIAPLGYLSIAAHGHADALAFTLSAGGRELLIDPGTYAYHTQKKWRDYFRGTSAHNTMRVDGVDQSVIGGNFLWIKHAEATCESITREPGFQRLVGSHDGYQRLSNAVTHRREWEYAIESRYLRVTDCLEGKGEHVIELFWHFAEDCKVTAIEGGLLVVTGCVELRMAVPAGLRVDLVSGDDERPLGWVSRSFDSKQPCTTAVASGRVQGGWLGTTVFEVNFT